MNIARGGDRVRDLSDEAYFIYSSLLYHVLLYIPYARHWARSIYRLFLAYMADLKFFDFMMV